MVDERYKAAYDAAASHLAQQDTTLGNLRNRATGVVSAAALITSFSSGLGLINTDKTHGATFPTWAAISMLIVVLVIGALTTAIAWPAKGWSFGPAASVIIAQAAKGANMDAINLGAATSMTTAISANANTIDRRSQWYRWAILLLVVEVAILMIALVDLNG